MRKSKFIKLVFWQKWQIYRIFNKLLFRSITSITFILFQCISWESTSFAQSQLTHLNISQKACVHVYHSKENTSLKLITSALNFLEVAKLDSSTKEMSLKSEDIFKGIDLNQVESDLQVLNSRLKNNEKNYFFLKQLNGKKSIYFDVYRNEDFLGDVDFIVSDQLPKPSQRLFKKVIYGYKKPNAKLGDKDLGVFPAIEMNDNKQKKNIFYIRKTTRAF